MAEPPPSKHVAREVLVSQDLFNEFDEFLVQAKSVLDHAAKLPRVILKPKSWTVRTWGDNGAKVLRALKNLPKTYQPLVVSITAIVFDENRDWLDAAIEARDRVNHYVDGGMRIEEFAVEVRIGGTPRVPMWAEDQSIAEFMEIVWEGLFELVESFTMLLLSAQLQRPFEMWRRPCETPAESPWKVEIKPELLRALPQPPMQS